MTNRQNFMTLILNLYDCNMNKHIEFCQNGFNNPLVIALELQNYMKLILNMHHHNSGLHYKLLSDWFQ